MNGAWGAKSVREDRGGLLSARFPPVPGKITCLCLTQQSPVECNSAQICSVSPLHPPPALSNQHPHTHTRPHTGQGPAFKSILFIALFITLSKTWRHLHVHALQFRWVWKCNRLIVQTTALPWNTMTCSVLCRGGASVGQEGLCSPYRYPLRPVAEAAGPASLQALPPCTTDLAPLGHN